MSRAYYNEIDPYAAQWLRNLIDAGHIAPGDVDERSIEDVHPLDLKDYTQVHFFAGVGIWSLALRRAGWPDSRPVWTGSCPCQPFSAAGKGGGRDDERHLWPAFYHLITQCNPECVFGEQVASKDGLGWLDLVQTDLEGAGYASAAIDFCSAGVGAPHIRQRLYFAAQRVADHVGTGRGVVGRGGVHRQRETRPHFDDVEQVIRVADDESSRQSGRGRADGADRTETLHDYEPSRLADTERVEEHQKQQRSASDERGGSSDELSRRSVDSPNGHPGPTNGHWGAADWLFCRDGKWRPAEPGTFPLAHGAASRVGRLRAYGNAINVEAAETFVRSYLDESQ